MRAEARDWFVTNLDPDRPLGEWWAALARSGWGFPAWPESWFGHGLPVELAAVVDEERRRAGAGCFPHTLGTAVIAPTLLEPGTVGRRERHLP